MRYRAAWTLGEIGDTRAEKPLTQTLNNDTEIEVKLFAEKALEKLKTKKGEMKPNY